MFLLDRSGSMSLPVSSSKIYTAVGDVVGGFTSAGRWMASWTGLVDAQDATSVPIPTSRWEATMKATKKALKKQNGEFDSFSVWTFNDGCPSENVESTRLSNVAATRFQQAMKGVAPDGQTALFTSILYTLYTMRARGYRQISLVVMSDGADNKSSKSDKLLCRDLVNTFRAGPEGSLHISVLNLVTEENKAEVTNSLEEYLQPDNLNVVSEDEFTFSSLFSFFLAILVLGPVRVAARIAAEIGDRNRRLRSRHHPNP